METIQTHLRWFFILFFFFFFQIGTLDGVDVAKSVISGLDSNTKFIFIGLAEGSLFH